MTTASAAKNANFRLTCSEVGAAAERVYSCRCGEEHQGRYAEEDWIHHNCFHDSPLVDLSERGSPPRAYLMCIDCGKIFHVDGKRENGY